MEVYSQVNRLIFWSSVLVLTPLSALGSLFMIVFILWNLKRDFSSRLIMNLSIADFGLSVICMALCGYNLRNGNIQSADNIACKIQPFITWYFMEASILWLSTISISSFIIIKFNKTQISIVEEVIAHAICWGVPFITSILPLINGTGESYGGRSDLWCSFAEDQKESQLLNTMIYYGINLIVIVSCYIGILYLVWQTWKSRIDNGNFNQKLVIVRRLFAFVLCYFLVWTPLTISYVWEEATGKTVSFTVEIIVDNLLHIQGILNFLIYGLNPNVINIMRKKYSTSTERSSIALGEDAI